MTDQARLEQTLKEAYAPGQLPFCHDKQYRIRFTDRELCELSEVELQRCPALKKACSVAPEKAHEAQEPRDSSFSVPLWLAMVAEVALWALLIALVVGILVSLLRVRRARSVDDIEPPSDESDDGYVPGAAPAAAPPAETDVQRLLNKARKAAERGELDVAIDAAHAAAMQGLSASGHLELERDRTNGDYLRDLRRAPPLHQDFKAIVHQVEAAQFGGAQPTRSSFDQVFDRVTSLLRRLAVLTLLALSGALLGCSGRDTKPTETQDTSPSGLYTFKRLLIDQGATVHTRIQPLAKLEDVSVIVAFDTDLEPEERDQLLRWVDDGGVLISVGTTDFLEAGELTQRYASCGRRAQLERGEEEEEAPLPLKLVVLGERTLRLNADSKVSHYVHARCGAEPYVVSAFPGEGAIRYVPETELLSNASLSVADNARWVAELVQVEDGGTVELVGPWTGDGSQSPLQSLKAAGLLPFMLQLLGLGLLLALRQGTSFGARRDDTKRERRAFADHVRAIASTYHRASAGHLVSGHYALLLLEQLRERVCPGQSPSLLQLAAAVARRTGRREPAVVELLVEAKSSLDEGIEGQGINHKLIRELEQLSLQVGGAS